MVSAKLVFYLVGSIKCQVCETLQSLMASTITSKAFALFTILGKQLQNVTHPFIMDFHSCFPWIAKKMDEVVVS